MSPKRVLQLVQSATLVIAVLLAGCGGSSSHSSTAASNTAPTTSTTAPSASTTVPRSAPKPRPKRTTPASTSTTATTPSSTGSIPPPPAPSGPDGLRVPSGYSTAYDNCQGACSGAVPASLRRPLQIPSAGGGCRASAGHPLAGMTVLGHGPVGPAQAGTLRVSSFVASAWSGARVTWVASAAYRGPLLIRGRRLGGTHAVGFGEGNVPVDELQLRSTAVPAPGGIREWPTFTRVRAAGCYAYQVDGLSFSRVVVFGVS